MISESKGEKSEAVPMHVYVPDCRKTFSKAQELGAKGIDEPKVNEPPDTDMRGGLRFNDLLLYVGTPEDVHKTWGETTPAKKAKA